MSLHHPHDQVGWFFSTSSCISTMGTPTTFSIYKTHIFGGFEALKRPSPFHDFFGCPKANTLEVNCSNLFSSLRAMKGVEKKHHVFRCCFVSLGESWRKSLELMGWWELTCSPKGDWACISITAWWSRLQIGHDFPRNTYTLISGWGTVPAKK